MIITGICGQTGAGKSTLADMLAERGLGENLEVDAIGHELLLDAQVKNRLVKQFGADILDADGAICRRSLGRKAFCSVEATGNLNQIMHPAMVERVGKDIEAARQKGKKAIIINAALLFSMGLDSLCNHLVYVKASPETRMSRLVELRNWSEASARERLFAQDEMPDNSLIIVIHNDASAMELALKADELAALLQKQN